MKKSIATSAIDMLFLALLGFVTLFILAYFQMNPVRPENTMKSKAEFIITVTWPSDKPYDVDTYVKDPLGKTIAYNRREQGFMSLDRDDLGGKNDIKVGPDGEVVKYDHNEENVLIRGIMGGEYHVSVHMYSMDLHDFVGTNLPTDHLTEKNGHIVNDEVEVTIVAYKLNPYSEMVRNTVKLSKWGEERPAFQFTIDKQGNFVSKDFLDIPILNDEERLSGGS